MRAAQVTVCVTRNGREAFGNPRFYGKLFFVYGIFTSSLHILFYEYYVLVISLFS